LAYQLLSYPLKYTPQQGKRTPWLLAWFCSSPFKKCAKFQSNVCAMHNKRYLKCTEMPIPYHWDSCSFPLPWPSVCNLSYVCMDLHSYRMQNVLLLTCHKLRAGAEKAFYRLLIKVANPVHRGRKPKGVSNCRIMHLYRNS